MSQKLLTSYLLRIFAYPAKELILFSSFVRSSDPRWEHAIFNMGHLAFKYICLNTTIDFRLRVVTNIRTFSTTMQWFHHIHRICTVCFTLLPSLSATISVIAPSIHTYFFRSYTTPISIYLST